MLRPKMAKSVKDNLKYEFFKNEPLISCPFLSLFFRFSSNQNIGEQIFLIE